MGGAGAAAACAALVAPCVAGQVAVTVAAAHAVEESCLVPVVK